MDNELFVIEFRTELNFRGRNQVDYWPLGGIGKYGVTIANGAESLIRQLTLSDHTNQELRLIPHRLGDHSAWCKFPHDWRACHDYIKIGCAPDCHQFILQIELYIPKWHPPLQLQLLSRLKVSKI
jgi:hypothetical protein